MSLKGLVTLMPPNYCHCQLLLQLHKLENDLFLVFFKLLFILMDKKCGDYNCL